jgi:rSAM/selenodomain-associated transferase 2
MVSSPPWVLSIIIPTYEEEKFIGSTLDSLQKQDVSHEVIVVDAGSKDQTVALSRVRGVTVISSPVRCRSDQMNLGARESSGNFLLFLHADTILSPGAFRAILQAFQNSECVGGAFSRRYDSSSRLLRMSCRWADLRGAWLGWFLGDSGIFIRRGIFESLGGYREIKQFEDLDLSIRMRQWGQTALLQPQVTSSARRFEKRGDLRTVLSDFWLTVRFLFLRIWNK